MGQHPDPICLIGPAPGATSRHSGRGCARSAISATRDRPVSHLPVRAAAPAWPMAAVPRRDRAHPRKARRRCRCQDPPRRRSALHNYRDGSQTTSSPRAQKRFSRIATSYAGELAKVPMFGIPRTQRQGSLRSRSMMRCSTLGSRSAHIDRHGPLGPAAPHAVARTLQMKPSETIALPRRDQAAASAGSTSAVKAPLSFGDQHSGGASSALVWDGPLGVWTHGLPAVREVPTRHSADSPAKPCSESKPRKPGVPDGDPCHFVILSPAPDGSR